MRTFIKYTNGERIIEPGLPVLTVPIYNKGNLVPVISQALQVKATTHNMCGVITQGNTQKNKCKECFHMNRGITMFNINPF